MSNGLKLGALYSYGCKMAERLKINPLLLEFIKNGTRKDTVRKYLEKLNSGAYYRIIASENNIKDIFDPSVVRAYWTGNNLTKLIQQNGHSLLLFHNFTVLESIFRASNVGPDNCKISVAQVEEVKDESALVYHLSLIKDGEKFFWANAPTLKPINIGFLDEDEVKKGDWITYHFGIGREKLKKEDADFLIKKTNEAIELFNKSAE